MSSKLPRRYSYEYVMALRFFDHWSYTWRLVGEHGAIHLHLSEYGKNGEISAGLETHWRIPPPHMKDTPPSHKNCELLGCPCWHDGTSLYAHEHFLPMWERERPEGMFPSLVAYADHAFNYEAEDKP